MGTSVGDHDAGPPSTPASNDVEAAIIEAARQLFSEQRPSSVSLRQIAARAGVNYGQIHHRFGTRSAVLEAVFGSLAARADARLDGIEPFDEFWSALWGSANNTAFVRLVALAVLDGDDPHTFLDQTRASTAVQRLVDRRKGDSESVHDERLVAAVVMLIGMGWKLFGPFLQSTLQIEDRSADDVLTELGVITDRMIDLILETAPDEHP